MPRVLGVAVATFCLTIVFILVAFASGYVFGAWLGKGSRDVWFFTNTVLERASPPGHRQHPRQKHPARSVYQRLLLHWRVGRRPVGHGYPARHATGADPLHRRTVCDFGDGIAADLPVAMNRHHGHSER